MDDYGHGGGAGVNCAKSPLRLIGLDPLWDCLYYKVHIRDVLRYLGFLVGDVLVER